MKKSERKILKDCRKLLVLEYVTGGGLCDEPLPASLAREGDAMLNTLLRDVGEALPDIQLVTLRDERCAPINMHGLECIRVKAQFQTAWRAALKAVDAVWIVAPETQGVLEALVREAEQAEVWLLNCSAEVIALCTSKQATANHLISQGIPALASWPCGEALRQHPPPELIDTAVVIKPDDGAGCLDTYVYADLTKAQFREGCVAQAYVEGEAQSLSLWCAQGKAQLLSVNRQCIERSAEGQLRFAGCDVNMAIASTDRNELQQLAQRIADALPGLYGPVGVDGVRGLDGQWHVVEVNPRLSTSFVALRQAKGINLMRWACGEQQSTEQLAVDRMIEIRVQV